MKQNLYDQKNQRDAFSTFEIKKLFKEAGVLKDEEPGKQLAIFLSHMLTINTPPGDFINLGDQNTKRGFDDLMCLYQHIEKKFKD